MVTVQPLRVILKGEAGVRIKSEVVIIPEKKYPFKIIGSEAVNGKDFRYELQPIEGREADQYFLSVENLRPRSGSYFGSIKLRTDSKFRPEIVIPVSGEIQDGTP